MERAEMANIPKRRCSDNKTFFDYLFMAGRIALAGLIAYFVLRERMVRIETMNDEHSRRIVAIEAQVSEIASMKTDIRWIRESLEGKR